MELDRVLSWGSSGSSSYGGGRTKLSSVRRESCGLKTRLVQEGGGPFPRREDEGLRVWMMGGGPRTYPGGARRSQWRRREGKEERKLERSRVSRERKLFHTRRRQELLEASLVEGIVGRNASSLVPGHRRAGSSAAGYLSEEAVGPTSNDSVEMATTEDESLLTVNSSGPGRRVSESSLGGWLGTRMEVAEQIEKVRSLVENRTRRLSGPLNAQTTSSFGQLSLSPLSLKALNFTLGIRGMTTVQEATLPIILQGRDLLAITKGGGEDMVASLAIELILKERQQVPVTAIGRLQQQITVSRRFPITVLLLCPTQERSAFVAADARLLSMFHSAVRVQLIKGGNDMRKEVWRLQRLPCEVLVATPGRLLAHLLRSPEFRGQLRDLKLFVLDEVQKLLDMGYHKTIERIVCLISRSRQTLLWSASQSDEVLALSQKLLKKDHDIVNTSSVKEGEAAYAVARQEILVVPIERHLELLHSLLEAHVEQEPNYKVVVFCQTVRTTTFMAQLYKILGFDTRELHMQRSEKYRERVSAEFRTSKGGLILFTCGASVWGVANPDVSLVVQVGAASGRVQYIRRVSLSGQEIKDRICISLFTTHEMSFLKELSNLPLSELSCPDVNLETQAQIQQAMRKLNTQVRVKAYLAWLRYHITRSVSTTGKQEVLQCASVYSMVLGFQKPPVFNSRTMKALDL